MGALEDERLEGVWRLSPESCILEKFLDSFENELLEDFLTALENKLVERF